MLYLTISLTFELNKYAVNIQVLLNRADTLEPHAGMRGPSWYTHSKGKCTCVSWYQIHPCWLTYYGCITCVTSQERSKRTNTPILFPNHALDHQRPMNRHTCIFNGFDRVQSGHQTTLHITGTTPIDTPIDEFCSPGIMLPVVMIAFWNHIDMSIKKQALSRCRAPLSLPYANQPQRVVGAAINFHTWKLGMLLQFRYIDFPQI